MSYLTPDTLELGSMEQLRLDHTDFGLAYAIVWHELSYNQALLLRELGCNAIGSEAFAVMEAEALAEYYATAV